MAEPGDDGFDDGVVVNLGEAKKKRTKKAGGGASGPPGGDGPSRQTPDPGECPVMALGKRGQGFAFMTPSGDIQELKPNQIGNAAWLAGLFDGDIAWLKACFPAGDKPGGFVASTAGTWLIGRAVARGYFDPDNDLRGPGAWRLSGGRLLLHLGDQIEVRRERGSPERRRAGVDYAGHIYYAAPVEPAPAEKSASLDDVRAFFDFLHRWRYGHAEDPRVLLGWIGCAYLAGALRWRPHVWVSGDTSTGKSTLELLIRNLLGKAALRVADTTKAYIAQRLKSAARPVLLDEIERDVDASRQKAIVELATLASTEGQAGLGRGSPDGTTRDYMIRACFYFSSIIRAPLKPQDRSRIHVVDLHPLSAASVEDIRAVKDGLARFGVGFPDALRARAVEGFWRFQANEKIFEEAINAVWLKGGRVVDQIGTLLAMAQMMLSDEVVTRAQAEAVLAAFETVRDELTGQPDETEARQCLDHLLTTRLSMEAERGRESQNVGELIDFVADARLPAGGVWDGPQHRELRRRGLAVVVVKEWNGQALAVAHNHVALTEIFEATRWNGGAWAQVLRRLPGAWASRNAVRFLGFQGRSTIVPLDALPLTTGNRTDDDDMVSSLSGGNPSGDAVTPGGVTDGVSRLNPLEENENDAV